MKAPTTLAAKRLGHTSEASNKKKFLQGIATVVGIVLQALATTVLLHTTFRAGAAAAPATTTTTMFSGTDYWAAAEPSALALLGPLSWQPANVPAQKPSVATDVTVMTGARPRLLLLRYHHRRRLEETVTKDGTDHDANHDDNDKKERASRYERTENFVRGLNKLLAQVLVWCTAVLIMMVCCATCYLHVVVPCAQHCGSCCCRRGNKKRNDINATKRMEHGQHENEDVESCVKSSDGGSSSYKSSSSSSRRSCNTGHSGWTSRRDNTTTTPSTVTKKTDNDTVEIVFEDDNPGSSSTHNHEDCDPVLASSTLMHDAWQAHDEEDDDLEKVVLNMENANKPSVQKNGSQETASGRCLAYEV